jgi:hypothetical protein
LLAGVFIIVVALLVVCSIGLGLLIALVAGRGQNTTKQEGTAGTADTAEAAPKAGETQLDRIESLVQRGNLTGLRLGVLAIGIAGIIFAGAGLELEGYWWRWVLVVLGLAAMFWSSGTRRIVR